jgi:hypothetical protein
MINAYGNAEQAVEILSDGVELRRNGEAGSIFIAVSFPRNFVFQ